MFHPDRFQFAIPAELLDREGTGKDFLKDLPALYQKINQDVRLQILILAAITVLAALLRFFHLGDWSFWIEEYHTVNYTHSLSTLRQVLTNPRPVFFLLLKPIFLLAGVNEWTARVLPTLLGVFAVPLLFGVAKKLYGLPVALLAALLLAISPWHLYWSQNARFYTLFLLLFNVSLFAFYWGMERDNSRYFLLALAVTILTVLTHGLGILLVPLFLCYYLILKILPFEKPAGLRLRNLLPFLLLPFVGYALYETITIFILHGTPLYSILFKEFSKNSSESWIGYSSAYIMLTSVIYYVGTPLALLAISGSLFQFIKFSRPGLLLSITAFVPLGLLMLLTHLASTANRFLFMTLPAWILLAAIGVHSLYVRARNGQPVWPWILGFLLLFIKDPAIEDILYYLRTQPAFRLLLPLGLLISILAALAVTQLVRPGQRGRLRVWGIGILGLIVAHAMVTDSLYFAYQNGHRDHWKEAIHMIEKEKSAADLVVTSLPTLVTYYLGEKTTDIKDIQLDTLLMEGQRVWIIEDYGLETVAGEKFDTWAEKNCVQRGNWDVFTAGVIWRLRVDLCDPMRQDT